MSIDPVKEHYRIARGMILKALVMEDPTPVDENVLLRILDDMGHPVSHEGLGHHLKYLQDKGYVELIERKGKGMVLHIVVLTAKGTDLVDGFIDKDPGVFTDF